MKRVLVIGSGGAGKSVFAKRLANILAIEVIHLDQFYWQSGWVEPPKDKWLQIVEGLLARDAWIMDGNYSKTLLRRLEACDTVIFLDLPRLTCLWRVVKRTFMHLGSTRPDMAPGCPERPSLPFLIWVWNYPRRSRQTVLSLLGQQQQKTLVTLSSPDQIEGFLEQLSAGAQSA